MKDQHNSAQQIAQELLETGINLPPLPDVSSRLLSYSHQAETEIDVAELSKLIEIDPAMASRILQIANSAYYGTLNRIVSLRQAIMHIGLLETVSAVNWILCQQLLPRFPKMRGFTDKDYWAHSWACATANRMLGRPDLMVNTLPGELYVAGLLHGIGKLILALYKPEEFQQCLNNSRDFRQHLEEAELDVIGTTDTYIAYEVLKDWQFPESICNAVKYYRNPQDAEKEFREAAALTQFAYYIANTSGIGNNGDEFCFDLTNTWLARSTTSPLHEEPTREKIVAEIQRTLLKKAGSIIGTETDKKCMSQAAEMPKPPRQILHSRKKPGTFTGNIMSFFKWLFS